MSSTDACLPWKIVPWFPKSTLDTRYSGTAARGHRWDDRWPADCPAPANRDSHNRCGDKNASRCPRYGGGGCRGHGSRPSRRRWSPCPDLLLTQGTVGLVCQAREWFGLGGTLTLRSDGLGWCLGSSTGWARPEVRQHEAQPEQDQDPQRIVNEVRNHRIAPLHDGVGGPF